jgi:hypothetical protein
MAINFNTEPYYDDFSEDKKFYRILYRPGYAVQARELTQMQTILQNQIGRFGDHIFKEGAMVIPGQISVDQKAAYIKLETSYNNILASTVLPSLLGKIVTSSSGIKAEVIHYELAANSDEPTIYVRYKDSGDDKETKTFSNSEVIADEDGTYEVKAIASGSVGTGSIATIQRGVYYVKGHFVLCEDQVLVLEKYSDSPTYRVGLTASEQIITPEDDTSLFDNAQNSFNYAAPGAHRYYIDLTLTKLEIDSTSDADFIELLRINDGTKTKEVTSTAYSELEKTLARRTFDESGNYSVKAFELDLREYRDNNRGAYASSRVYLIGDVVTNGGNTYVARNTGSSVGSTPPTHTSGSVYDGAGNTGIQWEYTEEPFYNRGVYKADLTANLATNQANEAKLAVGLEPGKAYVQGYEIEKYATEYVAVDKARDSVDVENATIASQIGNYVLVRNLNNLPPIENYAQINLYDRVISTDGTAPSGGTVVGTARVRNLEYHSGTKGTDTAEYKMFLFDVQMSGTYSFSNDVKGFYYNRSSDPQLSFTAEIAPVATRIVGSATASGTSVTGTGTSFETDLNVDDYVLLGTALRRVTAIGGQNAITVDSSVTVTGVTIDRVTTQILEPEKTSLLFPLDHYAIDTISNTTYSVTEVVTANAGSASGGTCTLSVPVTSGDAAAVDADSYLVVWNDATSGGAVINVAESDINPSGTNVEFTLPDTYAGDSFKVVITADKDSGDTLARRTKTLVSGATKTFTTQATATQTILDLEKADGFRLVSVKMDTGTFASPTGSYDKDITDRYYFDDGQRSTHYDTAKIVLKNSFTSPSAPIQVTFDYFTHNTGDYFTVDSYPANIDYKQIPYYKGTPLRDVYDFRPRINDTGGTFSSPARPPKRATSIRSDYTYYLARRTKIAVDILGNFFAIDGVSSLNPGDPLDPAMGMVLYKLELEPYTFGTGDTSIVVDKLDNRRYTMRDIGKLEKRIDNLEYYTSLSLLEQQTESLDVLDANGDSRFKNGFIVDGFAGHSTGDTGSPDYFCSIDMEQQELRPFFSMQNVNLIEKNSNDGQRSSSNYKLYGDVITLPLDSTDPHVALIKQDYASRVENINPFAVFTFLGDVKLNPSSDEWFEVRRRPDLVIDVEGNYTTIKNMAEKAGVLGTVWNSWQNNWVGQTRTTGTQRYTAGDNWAHARALRQGFTEISIAEMNQRFGGPERNRPARQIVVETQATEIGQTRTGIRTSIATKIDRQVVGDKILSTAAIPYIRSRNVLVQIKKLKPNTKFYPYFDGVDMSAYCTPASFMVYTPSGATDTAKYNTHSLFTTETNVGGLSSETARRIDGDSQSCLNKGDVITGSSSGATAVVVGKEYDAENDYYALKLLNIKGTFTSSETITGSVSAKTGTVTSVTTYSQGDDLVTDEFGEIELLFNIPNSDEVRFRCGTREFKMVDVDTADGDFTSRARANYYAAGVLETRQQTVHAVRNAELVEEQIVGNRVTVQTSERVVSDTGWYDPLAQTFLIDSEGGAFLSKVDIYFASKDPKIPVTLEIREVVNGYPGKRVLPFSRVTKHADDVNISSNTVLVDDVSTASYDTSTTFEFPSPVYVQNNTEYCFVLSSDSNNYKVWVSQVGDTVPGTSRTISDQPYLGSLFKSQNASTWTADQTQDIKFTIWRANFDDSVIGNVPFVNDVLPYETLEYDPFETRTGSGKVRVWHRDHGLTPNDRVVIEGVSSDVNGITAALFNSTHVVSDVDLDSYVITIATDTATEDGYGGGSAVRATHNIAYDALHPIVQIQTFPETTTSFSIEGITGKSVDGSQTAYQTDPDPVGVVTNENNYFLAPRMVASQVNETNSSLGGDKSLQFNVTMSTESKNISPILDTHRTSMVAISNKINNPSETNTNVDVLDDNTVISNSSNVTVASPYTSLTSSDTATKALLATLTVGKFVTVSGGTSGEGTAMITEVASDGSSVTLASSVGAMSGNVTVVQRELFVGEIAPENSSTYSKYVTRKVNLANPSNFVRIKFAGNIPNDAEVEVWYRTQPVGSTVSLEDISYTQVTPDADIVKAENFTNRFFDVNCTADNLISFDAVQVKLVLKSTNSAAIPRIKDLRIIACA